MWYFAEKRFKYLMFADVGNIKLNYLYYFFTFFCQDIKIILDQ